LHILPTTAYFFPLNYANFGEGIDKRNRKQNLVDRWNWEMGS